MADLRIVDAPLLSTVKGTEKIPTGGEGNFSVSIDQVADFSKLKWFLATEEYVDNAVGNVQADLNLHKNNSSNPHQVNKVQVGLGNVDNTADVDKPIGSATQAALSTLTQTKADKTYVDAQLNNKADKSTTYSKIETDSLVSAKSDTTYVNTKYSSHIKTYLNTGTALSNTVNGEYFFVISNDSEKVEDLYLNVNGVATNQNKSELSSLLQHNSILGRDVTGAHQATSISTASGLNQQQINDLTLTPFHFGAIGNGLSHKLSERYATLEQAKAVYPHAVSLDDEIDWCAITAILEKIKTFDIEIYSASKIVLTGNWQINKPLRFETNGFFPTNFTAPTIEMNCKLLLDNFASGQECVVFVGGTAFNFIGNLDFDVAKKAKHGLMSTNSEYLGTRYFPKCTNLPRCYINNAVMFNVFLENSMFATLPQYRGQGGGSGSLFSKDITTISSNVISGSGSLESISVLTVAKLPNITIDANEWVIVKVGEYYSIAKSAVGNAITVQPHIPTSAGTDLLYIYGGGIYTGGGDGAGIRIESMSSLDAVGLQHRALFSCNVDYICTEFTAVSLRDDGVVGGANINLAYYEGDGAQYIRTTRNQVGLGGSNIANATGLEINKFHDLSSGRDDNGLPVSSLGTLQGMSVNIKGLSYEPDVEKRANNVIPNVAVIDFNKPQHTSSILSNSKSLYIANVDEKYNELFGFDAQSVVVVGTGLNGAPTTVGFIPPIDGKYKVNGSTSEVIFKDFASAAVFECIVDFTNKNILISLVSRAASTQSPVPSSVTNTADLPINSFVFFDSLIAGMPIPIVSTSTLSNIKTEYSWGSSGRSYRLKQVLEFPESQEVWTRSNPSSSGAWGAWSLISYKVSNGATAQRPSNPQLGMRYYDTTLLAAGKPIEWNGAAWVDALGVAV